MKTLPDYLFETKFVRNSDFAILVDDPGNSDWNDNQVCNELSHYAYHIWVCDKSFLDIYNACISHFHPNIQDVRDVKGETAAGLHRDISVTTIS